jgi:hypothetical protein
MSPILAIETLFSRRRMMKDDRMRFVQYRPASIPSLKAQIKTVHRCIIMVQRPIEMQRP